MQIDLLSKSNLPIKWVWEKIIKAIKPCAVQQNLKNIAQIQQGNLEKHKQNRKLELKQQRGEAMKKMMMMMKGMHRQP